MDKAELKELVLKAIKLAQKQGELSYFDIPEVIVDFPERDEHGDYATNIALVIGKRIKKEPMKIAENLKSQISNLKSGFFERIEVARPGFINFWLSKEYLQNQVKEILEQGKNFGQLKLGKDKKLQVEFISANPTGPLTVGNARGGPLGDVLANVLAKAGYKTEKAYYINDYGQQILALGHSVLKDKEAQYKGDYIDKLHKKITEKDPFKAGQKAVKEIVKMIKKTTDRLGIKYDEWLWETGFHKSSAVDKALKFLEKKDLIYKKQGALWFKSSEFGDERDRVVVKKDGSKTYLAGDIALHKYKFEEKKFDKVINIWGADHYGDVPGLQAGVEALGHKGKLDIILLQFVTLLEKGKKLRMSKRKGALVTMDELLDKVPVDVIRFFFLQKSADTHLNFDLALAQEQSEKNPVYYVQYAYARIHSILAKSKIKNQKSKIHIKNVKINLLKHPSELTLIKQLIRFPEVVEDTARDYQVQRLPRYAADLATAFHQFYRDCRVICEDENLQQARLGLILATKTVLKNTLDLMGISAPEKM